MYAFSGTMGHVSVSISYLASLDRNIILMNKTNTTNHNPTNLPQLSNFLERTFHLTEHHTTVRREMLAGLTIFVSMAYILFVNPSILGEAGMDKGAVFTATAFSAVLGCVLMADSISMLAGSVMGTTATSAYVESSAGIAIGGRTGLTALTTGALFVLSLFFSPLLTVVTDQVTAPALIIVGVLMASALKHINWDSFEVALPAFLVIVGMPLTYNISYGIAFGFVTYPILMTAAGKRKEVNPLMWAMLLVFILLLYILAIVPRGNIA
ncbi:Permease family protein [Bifidobacterium commune]|uniref:Permease family protein n=2 Tax=Bifidobacterium commune TaxID=1505727 RepID=A0A1C4H0L2_9BIFI|nr:Permease family protein [Bifidobacterium commune]